MKRLIAIILTLCLLLSGCASDVLYGLLKSDYMQSLFPESATEPPSAFVDFVYVHPDMQQHDAVLAEAIDLAATETDVDALMDAVYAYYDEYDLVETAYSLSYIYYCQDPEVTYWDEEYTYCADVISDIEKGLEDLYCALAKSPIRDVLETDLYFGADFFDPYEDGGIWDETLLAFTDEDNRLQEEFYELSDAAADDADNDDYYELYSVPLTEILIQQVKLRKEMAAYLEYADAAQMAYEWYHYRDYSPDQVESYLEEIAETLAPLYYSVLSRYDWSASSRYCSSTQVYSYLESMVRAIGGEMEVAFDYMSENGLYDIERSNSKLEISYTTYLPSYYSPYIFICPEATARDQLTFVHEFGHFTNNYLCRPSYAGTDIAEIHSQAAEYLSVFYSDDGYKLEQDILVNCLMVYVEQSLFSLFEHRLYQLSDEQLTVENVMELFGDTCEQFGLGGIDKDLFTLVPHFYVEPMYMISYVVSNDLAFQIYQLEQETTGAGLDIYLDILYSEESYLLYFAEEYGLKSPFEAGHLDAVKATLEEALG